jgi:hypothetical protein
MQNCSNPEIAEDKVNWLYVSLAALALGRKNARRDHGQRDGRDSRKGSKKITVEIGWNIAKG